MCMPTTDEVVETVRQHLNGAMQWVKQQPWGPHPADDAPMAVWTRAVKTALCNACRAAWGACNDPYIFATQVGHIDQDEWLIADGQFDILQVGQPGRAAHETEFLFDVACLRYEEPWPTGQQVLLAAESEWNMTRQEILRDFAKLLVARAQLRVFVYNQDAVPFEDLAHYINQCGDTQAGDTYLLAAFGTAPGTPPIVYYRIDAHRREAAHQCELAPIQGNYYPRFSTPMP